MRQRSKLKIYEYQEAYKKHYDDGWGIRAIARFLGRSASTISRLLRRYVHPCPGIWKRKTSYEKAMYSWEKSIKAKSRKRLRLKSQRIRRFVRYVLCRWQWSPESISGFLKRHGVKISAKAIYNFIKKERPYLKEQLRLRGKPRRQRVAHPRGMFKQGVPNKKSIHLRPWVYGEGHWEIDTVHSKKGGSGAVLTLRELSSRRSFFFLIPDLTAKSTMEVLMPFFQDLPAHMRKTLTADNGPENSELYKLEKVLPNFYVFYCDPYKAYQRGSVENANGDLRWYFPKKTDFAQVTKEELKKAENAINSKPMRVNKGFSAKKVYNQFLLAA